MTRQAHLYVQSQEKEKRTVYKSGGSLYKVYSVGNNTKGSTFLNRINIVLINIVRDSFYYQFRCSFREHF